MKYFIAFFLCTGILCSCISGPAPAPQLKYDPLKPGFQSIMLRKGVSPYAARNPITFDLYIRDGGKKDRNAMKIWAEEFSAPSTGLYVEKGMPFNIQKKGDTFSVSLISDIRVTQSEQFTRVLSVKPIAKNDAYARIEVVSEKSLPDVRNSSGLYFFRSIFVESIESQNTDISDIDFQAEKVISYIANTLQQQKESVSTSGMIYLIEHTLVHVDMENIVYQVSFYIDFY